MHFLALWIAATIVPDRMSVDRVDSNLRNCLQKGLHALGLCLMQSWRELGDVLQLRLLLVLSVVIPPPRTLVLPMVVMVEVLLLRLPCCLLGKAFAIVFRPNLGQTPLQYYLLVRLCCCCCRRCPCQFFIVPVLCNFLVQDSARSEPPTEILLFLLLFLLLLQLLVSLLLLHLLQYFLLQSLSLPHLLYKATPSTFLESPLLSQLLLLLLLVFPLHVGVLLLLLLQGPELPAPEAPPTVVPPRLPPVVPGVALGSCGELLLGPPLLLPLAALSLQSLEVLVSVAVLVLLVVQGAHLMKATKIFFWR
mmetsp:Transcript_86252/g.180471  ORF Transcript_86252/g.180471 Transcript_86252/m.180471 type:complete len:306 (+) Transcript_86252:208-1125(+)